MILTIIGIILIIVSIILIIISRKINSQNESLFKTNKNLKDNNLDLQNKIKDNQYLLNSLDKEINIYQQKLEELQNNVTKTFESQKELSQKAFENYCELLDKQYEEEEEDYNRYRDTLHTAYSNEQLKLMQELEEVKAALDKIKATRAAAIQAQTREKEIEEKLSFYCLTIPETDIKDIGVLETVAPKLSKPRVLYMLIWQTFFRTPMTNLCNNVIGNTIKTGIYKITNIKTKECYIGQAMNLASRWKDHAKCGLGVDTPAGNKLYKAMQEYGIWNFSWEVIEECSQSELNEKEKYYIELYQSKDFGYNKTGGNK